MALCINTFNTGKEIGSQRVSIDTEPVLSNHIDAMSLSGDIAKKQRKDSPRRNSRDISVDGKHKTDNFK